MANPHLFHTRRVGVPAADSKNEAGGLAYDLAPKHKLAQYAATGCLHNTFYATADTQLNTILELCEKVEPKFIAQTAIYCREQGYMKDTPALLAAILTTKGQEFLPQVFERVINNGRMLRNFVQIIRSGAIGRSSLGTRPKKLIQQWLNSASEKELLNASVGNDPSLVDIVKMVHPHPREEWRETFFAWLIDKPHAEHKLPPLTQAFEAWKRSPTSKIPDVPFQMLTALPLTNTQWADIARTSSWQTVRMNLNTFMRHKVFAIGGMTEILSNRLQDPKEIARAKAFPYQLMIAYMMVDETLPSLLRQALENAMEIALHNVPQIPGRVVICSDVSGSMSSPITGTRDSATTKVRCIDVAGLITAAILRKNPNALVLPFENDVVGLEINPQDNVMANAKLLASIGGGGTNCSAPLSLLNRMSANADVVIFISDNESWLDTMRYGATATMNEWQVFRRHNPNAKMICLDLQPYGTTQAQEREDIINIGGFSDIVFQIMADFVTGKLRPDHWVGLIEQIAI